MNICLNLTNTNLAPGVKKPSLKLGFANNWDLTKLSLILFLDMNSFSTRKFI